MKTYIIASEEYRANWPDMFLMNEEGKYFGVCSQSYAKFYKFPKNVDFWRHAEGSDRDRHFYISEVELTEEQIRQFEDVTNKYKEYDMNRPSFPETYPEQKDYKTKKAYNEAVDKHMENYMKWLKESGAMKLSLEMGDLWEERARLFLSFDKGVADFLSDNDNIMAL